MECLSFDVFENISKYLKIDQGARLAMISWTIYEKMFRFYEMLKELPCQVYFEYHFEIQPVFHMIEITVGHLPQNYSFKKCQKCFNELWLIDGFSNSVINKSFTNNDVFAVHVERGSVNSEDLLQTTIPIVFESDNGIQQARLINFGKNFSEIKFSKS